MQKVGVINVLETIFNKTFEKKGKIGKSFFVLKLEN